MQKVIHRNETILKDKELEIVKSLLSGNTFKDITVLAFSITDASAQLLRNYGVSVIFFLSSIEQSSIKYSYALGTLQGSLISLPFADNTFDLVINESDVYNKSKIIFEKIIRETIRVLKPKGIGLFAKSQTLNIFRRSMRRTISERTTIKLIESFEGKISQSLNRFFVFSK